MEEVRIGCSGWSYDEWRGGLYPEGLPARRRLERYAEVFDTVEVNATFYRLPKEETVRDWTEQVPGDFRFAVKASRYLTHMKRLHDITDAVARFWEPLEPLRRSRRLGPVLWQLPENFQRDDALLAAALDQLPRADHCFEFRHPSWFAPPVRELLAERGASLAIGDDKRRPLPEVAPVGPFAYLRLHYGHRGRGGNYSETELDGWRRRIAGWRSHRPVFVYLNNDWKGYAPANARYLREGLSRWGVTSGSPRPEIVKRCRPDAHSSRQDVGPEPAGQPRRARLARVRPTDHPPQLPARSRGLQRRDDRDECPHGDPRRRAFHFDQDGPTVDRMPLGAFAGPALFIDLCELVEPAMEIGPEQLEGRLEPLREGDFAVLVTGWGGVTDEFMKRWPYLGGEGARLLLEHGVAGVGIDALSVGGWGGTEKGEPAHAAQLGAGRVIFEELHVPDELLGRSAFLTAFPILLAGCGGALARAVAWEIED